MATWTYRNTNAVTTGSTSYVSLSATTAAGDTVVALITITGKSVPLVSVTDNQAGSAGWTQVAWTAYNTTDSVHIWVRKNVATAAAMVVTATTTATNATGGVVSVYSLSGVEGGYVRGFGTATGAAATTPTVVLPQAALTGNPCIGIISNGTNPATMTPRATPAWTENAASDVGYNTPATGHEIMYINSGETGSSIAWGSTSASIWGAIVAEFYNAGTGPQPEDSSYGYYGSISAV